MLVCFMFCIFMSFVLSSGVQNTGETNAPVSLSLSLSLSLFVVCETDGQNYQSVDLQN